MQTRIWSAAVLAFALALTVGLAARQYPQSQQSSSDTNGTTIKVTGCVERASGATAGTSGTTGEMGGMSNTAQAGFLLTNVTTSGTSSSTGTSGSTMTANEYRLEGNSSKLSPHVGHKVEITGTVEPSSGMGQSTSGTEGSTGSAANAPKLKVDKVKMISSTCPS